MPDAPTTKSHATTWTLCILAAPLLYVLSVGPIIYLLEKRILPTPPPTWLDTFYAPLAWLDDHTPLKTPLDAYTRWWANLASKP